MTLRVVGAGLPRTGTRSLKDALELLLHGRCYHMEEVFGHPEHVPVWRDAVNGDLPDWKGFLTGYVAAVDWPASAFWRELSEANPDALVLLSLRDTPETWWESVDATILGVARNDQPPERAEWHRMFRELLQAGWGLREGYNDAASAIAAYERRVEEVRSSVPPERLVEWHAGDGWGPICQALDVPVPPEPFPHLNTREEWERGAAPNRDPG